ncbi:hypothetical protein [Crocinitomix catalasitica]|uniref:hypothetical protein n=1 Tax=Crocinitomix catalasitica TaxID=184607 RepID=UPI000486173F|nr:hypothetical protein [Crocinitomix catalasitica]
MKITVPLMLVVLSSCHLEASKTDIAKKMAADLCQSRMKFSFDKIVNVQDSVFKIFRNPIDSINEIIELYNIKPAQFSLHINAEGHKNIWFKNNAIIKIENDFDLYNTPIIQRYYFVDNCHWFYEHLKYDESETDSLIQFNLFAYEDTTILNLFVGAANQAFKFKVSIDNNHFAINKAKQVRKRLERDLEWYGDEYIMSSTISHPITGKISG